MAGRPSRPQPDASPGRQPLGRQQAAFRPAGGLAGQLSGEWDVQRHAGQDNVATTGSVQAAGHQAAGEAVDKPFRRSEENKASEAGCGVIVVRTPGESGIPRGEPIGCLEGKVMNNSHNPFENEDNELDREVNIEERIFPNLRRIQAINRETIEYSTSNGEQKFSIVRTANADCGCSCRLVDMYFCFLCQKIVCFKHAGASCSICKLPTLCHTCLLNVDFGDGRPILICIKCFQEMNTPRWKRLLNRMLGR